MAKMGGPTDFHLAGAQGSKVNTRVILCTVKNQKIRWCSDNQNVVKIVLHGSKKPVLQQEVPANFVTGMKDKIKL